MKKLMMIMAFAGFSAAVNAQEQPATAPDPNAPEIKWESTTIDYGKVKKGDENVATKEFKFTNIGKTPLILSSCRGSCGCTVPTCPTEPILPGKSGTISVHYDVQRVGGFTKTVTVKSNAAGQETKVLTIKGNVLADETKKEDKRVKMLIDLEISISNGKKRKLGKVLSERIYQYFFNLEK